MNTCFAWKNVCRPLYFPFLWLSSRWAAASAEVSANAMILPAALYYWQIPHFMALAYLCRNDYVAGGYFTFFAAQKIEKLHRMTLPCCNKLCLLYLGFGCSLLPMLLVRERHWYPSVIASTCFHWGFWHMIVSHNTLYSSSFSFEPFADRLWLKLT